MCRHHHACYCVATLPVCLSIRVLASLSPSLSLSLSVHLLPFPLFLSLFLVSLFPILSSHLPSPCLYILIFFPSSLFPNSGHRVDSMVCCDLSISLSSSFQFGYIFLSVCLPAFSLPYPSPFFPANFPSSTFSYFTRQFGFPYFPFLACLPACVRT